ncbi:double-strand-break repair protein rad21 homolog [Paramacrobiotus metropolitanus]|uniref:double-strand-break repair protein rad21 homolog n=1 Tax=Paramacrobiotus metropolitanus TaxID=2943436 RepID=UPI0024459DCB|nr:double-strand-break repair protein rad21 homolog [Paramacrobiotus metropolitanus]XP_055327722.1 double-strand-break repair protein rad21 homolog [Paramacrobiotus metropolitanus]XP_055327723.1 double-strand-break repair protein rad21 homolog [Paramacrobiotus metropolitanus]XP_055327724.1 double-strand-break repair protein rad21 homolog [Paramacrobiotus metropolitanus]XP_055327725.1 double-strand-break repair protein rad21 homolog [Paramacrobiotus metropolitanus]
MFYAHFVLSKKGPLAKVWLAAHWERKLTKTHVYETDIEETVENLLNPKIKLALRTSGHLLLGVVRIHSRKAKYLLQDCNEALSKIKQAFRPVIIDLPPEQRMASKSSITLPAQEKEINFTQREFAMVEIDFELDMEELSDAELKKRFEANQADPDSITLKETIIGLTKGIVDDTLQDDFGEMNLNLDDLMMSSVIPEEPVRPADGERQPSLSEEGKLLPEIQVVPDSVDSGVEPFPEIPAVAPGSTDLPPGQELFTGERSRATSVAHSIGPSEAASVRHLDDLAAVFPALPGGNQPIKDRVRAKRRRRLIIDEQKVISSDQMRAQLQDPSDIVRTLELGPRSDKLLYLREVTMGDKMWKYPGIYFEDGVMGLSQKLTNFFADAFNHAVVPRTDPADSFFPDKLDNSVERYSQIFQDALNYTNYADDAELPQPGFNSVLVQDDFDVRSPQSKGKRSHHTMEGSPDMQVPGSDVLSSDTQRPAKRRAGDEGEGEDEEAHAEDYDKMSKRTKEVFDQFSALLTRRHTPRHSKSDGSQSVNFEELIRGRRSRKEVAQRFYSALVLKKLQAVDVEQEVPYGEIWLKKGSRFIEFSK